LTFSRSQKPAVMMRSDQQFHLKLLRILRKRTFPITAKRCVRKIFTDLAVIEVTKERVVVMAIAPGWMPEEVQALS
jgi:acyl CoA:acetate/3-ketoacid CoA transferase beta subunit